MTRRVVRKAMVAVVYRIYTEGGDFRSSLIALTGRYFQGATFTHHQGYWEGKLEQSTTIEVVGTPADHDKAHDLAEDILTAHAQAAVLVTWQHAHATMLTSVEQM